MCRTHAIDCHNPCGYTLLQLQSMRFSIFKIYQNLFSEVFFYIARQIKAVPILFLAPFLSLSVFSTCFSLQTRRLFFLKMFHLFIGKICRFHRCRQHCCCASSSHVVSQQVYRLALAAVDHMFSLRSDTKMMTLTTRIVTCH